MTPTQTTQTQPRLSGVKRTQTTQTPYKGSMGTVWVPLYVPLIGGQSGLTKPPAGKWPLCTGNHQAPPSAFKAGAKADNLDKRSGATGEHPLTLTRGFWKRQGEAK